MNRRAADELRVLIERFDSGRDQSMALAGEIEGLILEEFATAPFFDDLSLSLSLYRPGGGDHLDDERALAAELRSAAAYLDAVEQPPVDTYELVRRLRYERIRDRSVSIGEPFLDGAYCLEKTQQGWAVFVARDRERVDEVALFEEGDACQEILRRVMMDSTTRTVVEDAR